MKKLLVLLMLLIFTNAYAAEKLPIGTQKYFNYLHVMTLEISNASKLLAAMMDNDEFDIRNPNTQKLGCELINATDRIIEIEKNKPSDPDNELKIDFRTVKAMTNFSIMIMFKLDEQGIHCPK